MIAIKSLTKAGGGQKFKITIEYKISENEFFRAECDNLPFITPLPLGVSDYQTTLDNNFFDRFIVVWNKPQGSIYLVS